MEIPEVWIQAALFPDFSLVFWAYEVDCFGNGDCYWEVFDDSDYPIGTYDPEEFADFLDFCRSINYDVKVNTYESWVLMEDWG